MSMGLVSPVITLGACPSLANIVGSVGSNGLLQTINNELNNSDFFGSIGDIMAKGRQMFITNHIEPIRQIGNTLKNIVGMFDNDDIYRPLVTKDDFNNIPACMHDPILRHKPIKKLFDQSRIFGFGWDHVPEEDCYGRLIANGSVADVREAMDANGEFELEYTFESTDPDLSFEELESIERTREYIDWILENTQYDPTDYPNDRA